MKIMNEGEWDGHWDVVRDVEVWYSAGSAGSAGLRLLLFSYYYSLLTMVTSFALFPPITPNKTAITPAKTRQTTPTTKVGLPVLTTHLSCTKFVNAKSVLFSTCVV